MYKHLIPTAKHGGGEVMIRGFSVAVAVGVCHEFLCILKCFRVKCEAIRPTATASLKLAHATGK